MQNHVAFGQPELYVAYFFAVKDGKGAFAFVAKGVENDIAFIGDKYVVEIGAGASLSPVGFQLVVIQTHLHLGALRCAVGHKDPGQQLPVGRYGVTEVEVVAFLAAVVGQHQRLAFGGEGGKTAAVAEDTHAFTDVGGVEQVDVTVVDVAAIAIVVFTTVHLCAALFLKTQVVLYQLQTVLEAAAALDK